MKGLKQAQKRWVIAVAAGLGLTVLSLLYLAGPVGEVWRTKLPQLRWGGPEVQVTWSEDDSGQLYACPAVMREAHRGFPAAAVSLYGGGCDADYFVNLFGLGLNLALYSLLAYWLLGFKRNPGSKR